jgi:hypothetical protein
MAERQRAIPDGPYEVMVDSWGHGEIVKGDIVEAADLEGYDVAWALKQGVIRPFTAEEARLLDERPMESTTRPLTAEGAVDQGVGAAVGATPDALATVDLTDEQRSNLVAAGYGDAAAIRTASDAELEAVPSVGPAAVKRIREATAS